MSTRFNTFGSSTELATESTQKQIKNILDETLNVNVTNFTPEITSNITKVNGTNIIGSNLPIDIKASTIDIPVINGNTTLETNVLNNVNTTVTNTVQTTVFGTVSTISNSTEINGNTISTQNGTSDGGTQRVILANNQDTSNWQSIPTNLKSLNGNTIATNLGPTDNGTIRITTPLDFDPGIWPKQQIQIPRYNELGQFHLSTETNFSGTDTYWRQITPSAKRFIDLSAGYSADFWLPSLPTQAYISSTSIADTWPLGTGLITVTIIYYDVSGGIHVVNDLQLNGTTRVAITGSSNFYRLGTVLVRGVGSLLFNQGDIYITDTTGTLFYPGVMANLRNQWTTSYIYINQAFVGSYTGKFYGKTFIDYINYLWHNGGGSEEVIGIFVREIDKSPAWKIVNKQWNNNDIFYSPNISNITFNTESSYVEIMFALLKTLAGTTQITLALGHHYE